MLTLPAETRGELWQRLVEAIERYTAVPSRLHRPTLDASEPMSVLTPTPVPRSPMEK